MHAKSSNLLFWTGRTFGSIPRVFFFGTLQRSSGRTLFSTCDPNQSSCTRITESTHTHTWVCVCVCTCRTANWSIPQKHFHCALCKGLDLIVKSDGTCSYRGTLLFAFFEWLGSFFNYSPLTSFIRPKQLKKSCIYQNMAHMFVLQWNTKETISSSHIHNSSTPPVQKAHLTNCDLLTYLPAGELNTMTAHAITIAEPIIFLEALM